MKRLLLALCLSLAAPRAVRAESGRDEVQREARERFDRGLRLFNQEDNAGALAEFERAYELVAHPLVLFNIGLVHVAMHKPVEAVDAFDRLLQNPGVLDAERLATAHSRRDEQAALIGEIRVTSNVDGAAVEVDNLTRARTPLARPIRVASGQHLVALVAPGYAPARREVTVAGQAQVVADFSLVRAQGKLARVAVETNVPDVEVLVDGVLAGKTPLATPLTVAAGAHTLELRRAGYLTEKRSLNLGEGTHDQVHAPLAVDRGRLSSAGGLLAMSFEEPDTVVFIDGAPRAGAGGAIALPSGRHRLRAERAGFFPFERDVTVLRGRRSSVHVALLPTPEKRASYRSSAVTARTWAWIGVGAGAALAAGGATFLIWNQGQKDEKKAAYERALERYGTGECRPSLEDEQRRAAGCTQGTVEVDIRFDAVDSARRRDLWGWVGVGAGAAALGAGLFLHAIRDDPERYEPRADSDLFAGGRFSTAVWAGKDGGGLGVNGNF